MDENDNIVRHTDIGPAINPMLFKTTMYATLGTNKLKKPSDAETKDSKRKESKPWNQFKTI